MKTFKYRYYYDLYLVLADQSINLAKNHTTYCICYYQLNNNLLWSESHLIWMVRQVTCARATPRYTCDSQTTWQKKLARNKMNKHLRLWVNICSTGSLTILTTDVSILTKILTMLTILTTDVAWNTTARTDWVFRTVWEERGIVDTESECFCLSKCLTVVLCANNHSFVTILQFCHNTTLLWQYHSVITKLVLANTPELFYNDKIL